MNATKSRIYPDFNTSMNWGMPFNTVPGSTPKFAVNFYYGDSDAGPYPIPSNVNIESGYDHHAIIIDTNNCVLYELFNLSSTSSGWRAGSGAIFPLNSNALRPAGWTSADAAGLPIFPGMVRVDEVLAGHINHALRVTADHTRNQYIWPARHAASHLTGAQYPPMGQRFRLKASFDISRYPAQARVILQALKTYGLILADNGPSWDLTGASDPRWDDNALNSIKSISGSNFEAVDESSLMINQNSAQARPVATSASSSAPPIPTGWVNVISKNSGKCLDVTGGRTATQPTAPLQQWSCAGTTATNQHFQFVPVSGGYEIKARHSGLAVQVRGGTSTSNGDILEQWGFENASYQIWTLSQNSDGTFQIRPRSNGSECMDVSGISKLNTAPVQVWSCWGGDNQKWTLVPIQ